MGRKLLKISYLGTEFCGWQVQPNGVSVQQTLQNALQEVLKTRPDLTGCSRTDSGVHAKEFYCHFDSDTNIPNKGIISALNTVLCNDIAVLDCKDVPDSFHARYSAKGKTYGYYFYCSNTPDPFLYRRALQLKTGFDLEPANEYCGLITGKHDFASFSSSHRSVINTVRTVTDCRVVRLKNSYAFFVSADGFLYNMVRIMVGTMFDYARGRITEQNISDAFKGENRSLLGYTAPAHGLYLERVYY